MKARRRSFSVGLDEVVAISAMSEFFSNLLEDLAALLNP